VQSTGRTLTPCVTGYGRLDMKSRTRRRDQRLRPRGEKELDEQTTYKDVSWQAR
jgi:hypothetical protein